MRIKVFLLSLSQQPYFTEIHEFYVVLRLVDSEVVPTMPFVYELMHVMKENIIRQGAGDWMFKIIQDRWEKTLKHPLRAAGTYVLYIFISFYVVFKFL